MGAGAIRWAGMTVYVVALATWMVVMGLPKQTLLVIGWMWLATIAWDVRRPWREHLAFARDWWPVVALLTAYLYSRGLSDDLGFASVHVTEPITIDRWLFGGVLPTAWLQAELCGVPCERGLPPRWYDVVLSTVYYSHFFVGLGVGVALWVRNRSAWIGYMRRYISLSALALVIYVVYPMAPPWMAARDGQLSSDINRITSRGWFDLGQSRSVTGGLASRGEAGTPGGSAHDQFTAVGNQVAAMPSLHAGLAMLVAVFAIVHLRSSWRWLMLAYPLAMSFALVYFAEHYVIDVIAGFACVAVVLVGWSAYDRRRAENCQDSTASLV